MIIIMCMCTALYICKSAFLTMLVTSYYSCKDKTHHVDSFLIGAIGISSIANKWNGGIKKWWSFLKYKVEHRNTDYH